MSIFLNPDLWKPPPEQSISEWAEENIILPVGVSGTPGPIDLDLTPYMRGPLEAATDKRVSEIILCTSSQVAKTTFLTLVSLHTLAADPANQLFVFPTEGDANDFNTERYQPIIQSSPAIASLSRGRRGEFTSDSVRLNGVHVSFRGANSASGLSSKPARLLVADEVDKWPQWTGREAGPLDLLGERAKTYSDALLLKASTPTTPDGLIWRELSESTNERYNVPCPHCGAFQELVMGSSPELGSPGIKWPERCRDPERILYENLAWYECAMCQGKIGDRHKPAMIRAGIWVPRGQSIVDGKLVGPSPPAARKGYHLWAAYGLWAQSSFSSIAAKFLRSKGEPQRLMNFRNSWQGLTWEVTVNELDDGGLRAKVDPTYHQGTAKDGALLLTAGIDVQSRNNLTYQYYVIRAWGKDEKSWLVREGISEGWEVLKSILFDTEYKDASGRRIPLHMAIIDSGYKADEVYQFCALTGCFAYKGQARAHRHINVKQLETFQGSGQTIPFVVADPSIFKSKLHRLIRSPGRWHLPSDIEEEYISHMTAEQQVSEVNKRSGRCEIVWKITSEGRPNHLFDCEVLALIGAELLQVSSLSSSAAPTVEPRPSAKKKERREPKRAPQHGIVRTFS